MIITAAVYDNCSECGTRKREITPERFGCDGCNKELHYDSHKNTYLSIRVMFKAKESTQLDFCSWRCALRKLKTLKTDYFISLPYLHFDEKESGIRAKDFLPLIDWTKVK